MPYTQGSAPVAQGSAGMGHCMPAGESSMAVAQDVTRTTTSDMPAASVMEEACQSSDKPKK